MVYSAKMKWKKKIWVALQVYEDGNQEAMISNISLYSLSNTL